MKRDKYAEDYYKAIKSAENKKEVLAIINKLYEDGFVDGSNEGNKETIKGEIFWDKKGKPLFAIIPLELNVFDYMDLDKGIITIDGDVDNSSEEELTIKDNGMFEVI